MREFMDYVHGAFYEATGWSRDNSYAALNSTSDGMLRWWPHWRRVENLEKNHANPNRQPS